MSSYQVSESLGINSGDLIQDKCTNPITKGNTSNTGHFRPVPNGHTVNDG